MPENIQLDQSIEALMETLPPTWGRIRNQVRDFAIKGYGISLIQFHILRHSQRGMNTAAALAQHLQISRPAVSQAVEGLVQKGLLQRLPSQQDRRNVFLAPSPAGAELLKEAYARNRVWMAECLAGLSAEELKTLNAAMQLLQGAFQIPPKARPEP